LKPLFPVKGFNQKINRKNREAGPSLSRFAARFSWLNSFLCPILTPTSAPLTIFARSGQTVILGFCAKVLSLLLIPGFKGWPASQNVRLPSDFTK
jgi:hypothetical protein